MCGLVDKLDGVEVVCTAAACRRQRHGCCHGPALKQNAESSQRPQLEGCKGHDVQGVYCFYVQITKKIITGSYAWYIFY